MYEYGECVAFPIHLFTYFISLFFLPFIQMDTYERRKKSDKAKDKAGKYTTKHVRATEALMAKAKARPISKK
jgi:hypothetical protein